LHAVQIAEECSVHKKGRAVVCLLIEQSSLPLDVRSLLRSGPGLVTFNRTHFVVVRKSM
jgi:hypothetical protein